MSELGSYVTAAYRTRTGRRADPRFADFIAAFAANPAMASEARDELAQLKTRGAARTDFRGDHEGKIRAQTLEAMLQQFDARK